MEKENVTYWKCTNTKTCGWKGRLHENAKSSSCIFCNFKNHKDGGQLIKMTQKEKEEFIESEEHFKKKILKKSEKQKEKISKFEKKDYYELQSRHFSITRIISDLKEILWYIKGQNEAFSFLEIDEIDKYKDKYSLRDKADSVKDAIEELSRSILEIRSELKEYEEQNNN